MAKGKASNCKKKLRCSTYFQIRLDVYLSSTNGNEPKATKKHFIPTIKKPTGPVLLDLPLEVRREIYRYLVGSQGVSKRIPDPAYTESRKESESTGHQELESDQIEIGSVGCQNIWNQTFDYQLAILSVDRQIYQDVKFVMATDNVWITVKVNKGIGKEMKVHGLAVVSSKIDEKMVSTPYARITMKFPLPATASYDNFLMTNAGFFQLRRGLWGKKMDTLSIDLHQAITANPASEDAFLQSFYQLRGIRHLHLSGARTKKHRETMAKSLTTLFFDGQDILLDLEAVLGGLPLYFEKENYVEAAHLLESQIAFLAVCHRFPGPRFLSSDNAVYRKICQAIDTMATNLANARLKVRGYESVVKYATLAMSIVPLAKQSEAHLLNFQRAHDLDPGDPALTDFQKQLQPDPQEAFKAYANLRMSLEEGEKAKQKKLDDLLNKLCTDLPVGLIVTLDSNWQVVFTDLL